MGLEIKKEVQNLILGSVKKGKYILKIIYQQLLWEVENQKDLEKINYLKK